MVPVLLQPRPAVRGLQTSSEKHTPLSHPSDTSSCRRCVRKSRLRSKPCVVGRSPRSQQHVWTCARRCRTPWRFRFLRRGCRRLAARVRWRNLERSEVLLLRRGRDSQGMLLAGMVSSRGVPAKFWHMAHPRRVNVRQGLKACARATRRTLGARAHHEPAAQETLRVCRLPSLRH